TPSLARTGPKLFSMPINSTAGGVISCSSGQNLLSSSPRLLGETLEEKIVASRINRAIELLGQDQAIYYDGAHTGHVLTHAQGREDAGSWADYINVGMEHGAFDMAGLAEYLRGMVEGGPTRSGHRTPTVIVEAPVNGTDETNVRHNAWQF